MGKYTKVSTRIDGGIGERVDGEIGERVGEGIDGRFNEGFDELAVKDEVVRCLSARRVEEGEMVCWTCVRDGPTLGVLA